jgi:hypothetical protein
LVQQRVDDQRGAVLDEICFARVDPGLADAIEDRLTEPIVGGRALGVGDRAGLDVAGDEVGEGAADINGNDVSQNISCLYVGAR